MKKQLLAGIAAAGLTLSLGAITHSADAASQKTPCGQQDNGGSALPAGSPTNVNGAQDGMGGWLLVHGNNGYLEASGGDKAGGGTIDGRAYNGSNQVHGSITISQSPKVCIGTSATGAPTKVG